jgi:predicted ATPase with chaperone activity
LFNGDRVHLELVTNLCRDEAAGALGTGLHRILKVARTIADLGAAPDITPTHLAKALQCRPTGPGG